MSIVKRPSILYENAVIQAHPTINQRSDIPKTSLSNAESTVGETSIDIECIQEFRLVANNVKRNNKLKKIEVIDTSDIPYDKFVEKFMKSFLSRFPIMSPLTVQIHQHKGYFRSLANSLIRIFSDSEKYLAERNDPTCESVIALINLLTESKDCITTLFKLQLHILAAVYSLDLGISDIAQIQLNSATRILFAYQATRESKKDPEFLMTRLAFIDVFREYRLERPKGLITSEMGQNPLNGALKNFPLLPISLQSTIVRIDEMIIKKTL